MGNSHPSQNSRSFSDDMLSHHGGAMTQRPHSSSDTSGLAFYNNPTTIHNNNHTTHTAHTHSHNIPHKPIKPIFSPRSHYNHINGIKSSVYTLATHPQLSNNNSDSSAAFSRSQSEHAHVHSTHVSHGSHHNNKVLIMEGWLTKRGESSKKLKKRYWKLYDNGKLSYNTKQTGSFKKYADLKVGIDHMSFSNDLGFEVEVSGRHLTFYAETTRDRDAWFAIIYRHYFEKGKAKVKLLAKSSGDKTSKYKEEDKDKFEPKFEPKLDIVKEKQNQNQNKKKKSWRKKGTRTRTVRRNSFDSTKAAITKIKTNQKNQNKKNPMTPPPGNTHTKTRSNNQRSQSTVHNNNNNNNNNNNRNNNGRNGQPKNRQSKEDGMLIFSELYMAQECDGKTCLSLERVHYVLKKYDVWRDKENKIISLGMYRYINNGLGEFYNNTQLLNDYNHLIEYHDNVFHHIYQYFDGECELEKCLLIKRLHRDRNYYKNDLKRKQIYYNYEDPREINTQQILDKIHCFYRHSYDLGFKIRKSKLLTIADNARRHKKWKTNSKATAMSLMGKKQKSLQSMTTSIGNEESKEAQLIIIQNDTVTDNESERKSNDTDDMDDDDDDDSHGFEDEWKLLEICGLIKQKRDNLRDIRGIARMNTNKFVSLVGKSQRYHYWNKYDDDDEKNWHVTTKYKSFKDEILSNNLYFISLKQWQYLNEKANDHFDMRKSRKIRPHKYWAELYELPKDSNLSFSITKSHLIAIILYCNFDILQRVFAQTFYKTTETENDEQLKERHSNFYHFGRLLRELIECFGKKIYNKNIVFYHGITDNMMFIETTMYFHAPLSTTTSIEVAIAYSHPSLSTHSHAHDTNLSVHADVHADVRQSSLLLELMDDDTVLGMARYFDCYWLSDFGNECEKYFIGGYKPLKIHTVLDAVLGRNYINYLKALHIIDEMMQGYYFDTDSDEIKQIILHLLQEQITNRKKKMSQPTAVNSELLKEIHALNTDKTKTNSKPKMYLDALSDETEQDFDPTTQLNDYKSTETITVSDAEMDIHRRRISRKISESFANYHNKALSTMDMEQYDYFNETPKYITKLVDYYCLNISTVCIDWTNICDSNLRGWKFIKKLLCVNDKQTKYEWIKLNTFLTLFPNLKELNVRNIKLSCYTIKDIHKFLSKAKENNKYNDLYRIEIFEVDQSEYPISKCLEDYLDKFKDVGWTITFNPFEDEMCFLKILTQQ